MGLPIDVTPNGAWILWRGDEFAHDIVLEDDQGVPIDLTGYVWEAMARPGPDSNKKVDIAIDTSQANVGRLSLSLTSVITADMTPQKWGFDVAASNGALVATWFRGKIDVEGDFTHA